MIFTSYVVILCYGQFMLVTFLIIHSYLPGIKRKIGSWCEVYYFKLFVGINSN